MRAREERNLIKCVFVCCWFSFFDRLRLECLIILGSQMMKFLIMLIFLIISPLSLQASDDVEKESANAYIQNLTGQLASAKAKINYYSGEINKLQVEKVQMHILIDELQKENARLKGNKLSLKNKECKCKIHGQEENEDNI